MRVAVVTLFPELFAAFSATSFVGRAVAGGQLQLIMHDLRVHGRGVHRSVDDTPYGGGSGMVMRADCVVEAIEAAEEALGQPALRILMTPQGARFDQRTAVELAQVPAMVLVCGRYEGFDERVRAHIHRELSLGDFVLTGGELPAMAMLEAAVRLVPGVLGNRESVGEESFSERCGGRLEYPHYTRPATFRGVGVPEVLQSGHHAQIEAWRQEQSRLRTSTRRPDLLEPGDEGT